MCLNVHLEKRFDPTAMPPMPPCSLPSFLPSLRRLTYFERPTDRLTVAPSLPNYFQDRFCVTADLSPPLPSFLSISWLLPTAPSRASERASFLPRVAVALEEERGEGRGKRSRRGADDQTESQVFVDVV